MDANNPSGLVPQATFPGLLGAQLQEAVERALPWCIRGLLRTYPKLFVAGGFIRDAAVRVPYHDIDIYLGGENLDNVGNWLLTLQPDANLFKESERGRTFDCPVTNFNTDGAAILWGTRPVQLLRSEPGEEEVVGKFDLDNCTAWFRHRDALHYGDPFRETVRTGICTAARGNINPRTYHRMERMKAQGWKFVEGDTWQAYDCFMANGGGRDSG